MSARDRRAHLELPALVPAVHECGESDERRDRVCGDCALDGHLALTDVDDRGRQDKDGHRHDCRECKAFRLLVVGGTVGDPHADAGWNDVLHAASHDVQEQPSTSRHTSPWSY